LEFFQEFFHSNEKDSIIAPFCKHGLSIDNKHEILGQSDIHLIQEMYGQPKSILFNSKTAKVAVKQSPTESLKGQGIFTWKLKHFGENFDENFQMLLAKLSEKNMLEFLKREF